MHSVMSTHNAEFTRLKVKLNYLHRARRALTSLFNQYSRDNNNNINQLTFHFKGIFFSRTLYTRLPLLAQRLRLL